MQQHFPFFDHVKEQKPFKKFVLIQDYDTVAMDSVQMANECT